MSHWRVVSQNNTEMFEPLQAMIGSWEDLAVQLDLIGLQHQELLVQWKPELELLATIESNWIAASVSGRRAKVHDGGARIVVPARRWCDGKIGHSGEASARRVHKVLRVVCIGCICIVVIIETTTSPIVRVVFVKSTNSPNQRDVEDFHRITTAKHDDIILRESSDVCNWDLIRPPWHVRGHKSYSLRGDGGGRS